MAIIMMMVNRSFNQVWNQQDGKVGEHRRRGEGVGATALCPPPPTPWRIQEGVGDWQQAEHGEQELTETPSRGQNKLCYKTQHLHQAFGIFDTEWLPRCHTLGARKFQVRLAPLCLVLPRHQTP